MRDLIASNAPLREGSHKARPAYTKTLTPGIQGDRNPLGTPFSPIFRRATKDGATGGREQSRAAGKKRTAKDGAPGGRSEKRMPVKT